MLYWCFGQLGVEAEAARQGTRQVTRLHADESKNKTILVRPPMATRKGMLSLSRKAIAAARAIRKHRTELLLAAEGCQESIDLPTGLMTELQLPEEAIALLLSSLSWVNRLADSWQSPNPTQLMKSKGLLFLLTYTWLCSNSAFAPSRPRTTHRMTPPTATLRLSTDAAQEVAASVHIYLSAAFAPGDLSDKLQDFGSLEPALFAELIALLGALHSSAVSAAAPKL